MAHFAKLDNDNNVIDVFVVDNNDILDEEGNESESLGEQFLQNLFQFVAVFLKQNCLYQNMLLNLLLSLGKR